MSFKLFSSNSHKNRNFFSTRIFQFSTQSQKQSRPYRLLFLGPPGVGKGTYAKLIAPQLSATIVDTGRILRKITGCQQSSSNTKHKHEKHNHSHYNLNLSNGPLNYSHTGNHKHHSCHHSHNHSEHYLHLQHNNKKVEEHPLYKDDISDDIVSPETKQVIETHMMKGELVPDSVLLPIMLQHLQSVRSSFILDGFPRTVSQIQWLYDQNFFFDLAVRFHLPDRILLAKLNGRRTCQNCGSTYNVAQECDMNDHTLGIHLPSLLPKIENKCDDCDGNLISRSGDTLHALQNRMNSYYEETEPVIKFLNENKNLLTFDIKKGIEDSDQLLHLVKQKLEI